MFEKLKVQNFQAHSYRVIRFDPKITTIVGPSDAGKTAIIRMLRWICFNRPDGTEFIRRGEEFAKGVLVVDGKTITRSRGKENKYKIGKEPLVAFGRGKVPDVIESVLNVGPENFQLQHDAPYWFALSPGEVSRQLNAIVDLGIIDAWMTKAQQATRRATAATNATKSNLADAREELRELKFVPELEAEYDRYEARKARFDETAASAARMSDLVNQGKDIQTILGRSIRYEYEARILAKQAKTHHNLADKANRLSECIETAREAQTKVSVGAPDFSPIEEAYDKHQETTQRIARLRRLIDQLKPTENRLCQSRDDLNRLTMMLPRVCPTCGKAD